MFMKKREIYKKSGGAKLENLALSEKMEKQRKYLRKTVLRLFLKIIWKTLYLLFRFCVGYHFLEVSRSSSGSLLTLLYFI